MPNEIEQGDSDSVAAAKHLSEVAQIQARLVNGSSPVDELALERLERLSLMLGAYVPELLDEIDKLETALEKAEDKYEMANQSWVNASAEEKQRHQTMVDSIRATNRELNLRLENEGNASDRIAKRVNILERQTPPLVAAMDKAVKLLTPKKEGTVINQAGMRKAVKVLSDALIEAQGGEL